MSNLFKKGLLAVSTVSLVMMFTGCTTTPEECDPSKDQGFFGKIGCAVSGSYDERIEQKQQQLADLKAENEQLNALIADLNSKDALVKASYQERKRELNKTLSEIKNIESSLKQKEALSADLQMQINDVVSQIQSMQKTGASETLRKKQSEVKELQRVLDDLKTQIQNESL